MAGESGAGNARLLGAVQGLRSAVSEVSLPLDLPGSADGRSTRTRLLDQLDDYVIPRLTSIDAPLLAVVGGSTGAGKSTLVNSVVGGEVSLSGVLRPTTRSPVLVHHPSDAAWFSGQRILPGLARITGRHSSSDGPGAVRLVSSESVAAGLALLDAPDIDSVVEANRELAGQLLAAADLWIFVTTAARYADAVPWHLLREASERGTAVAVVLDRVPPAAVDEIRTHLAAMLREQGLERAPIFTVLESELVDGLLPADQIERLRGWLAALAGDAQARAVVVRQTLEGALTSLDARTQALLTAGAEQAAAGEALLEAARTAYGDGDHPGARGHGGRQPAARRGARPLAGVRRHGGVLPPGRVDGLAGARPLHLLPQGRAGARRQPRRGAAVRRRGPHLQPRRARGLHDRSRLARPARRRPAARGRPGVSPGRATRPGRGPSGSCATGRATSSRWCGARARTVARRPASWPTASTASGSC